MVLCDIIDTNYADNGTKLLTGISRQLVRHDGSAPRLIKQWPGLIKRIATNLAKGSIGIVRTKNEINITATPSEVALWNSLWQ